MGISGGDFGPPTAFLWFFGFVVLLIACSIVLGVVTAVRNRRVLKQAGLDPMTVESQLAVRLLRSQALSEPAAATRLAELDDLRNRGLITSEEYATRRAEIIRSI